MYVDLDREWKIAVLRIDLFVVWLRLIHETFANNQPNPPKWRTIQIARSNDLLFKFVPNPIGSRRHGLGWNTSFGEGYATYYKFTVVGHYYS